MYRESYYRCIAKTGCGSLLPDEGTMIDAAHTAVMNNPIFDDVTKGYLGDAIQRHTEADPRPAEYY